MAFAKWPLVLGALAGAGLGTGVLALRLSGSKGSEASEAGAALREIEVVGLPEGDWRIEEPMRSRVRTFRRDPADADIVQIHLPEQPGAPVAARQVDLVHHLLGDVNQFLLTYRISRPATSSETAFGRARVFTWQKIGCDDCASRTVWFDDATGRLVKVEEKTSEGFVFRTLSWQGAARPARLTPMAPERDRTPPKVSERDVRGFDEFVRRVPFAVYEPASLPPGFVRIQYGYDDRPPRGDATAKALPIAWVSYGDGLLRMNLFLAPPEEMKRLEALSRRRDAVPGPSTCPTTPADAPEDLIEEPGAITVRRRSDGCRTVLRRDDLDGVVVALVGYPGLPAEAYVRAIRGLVRVKPEPATRAAEEPRKGVEEPLRPVGGKSGK